MSEPGDDIAAVFHTEIDDDTGEVTVAVEIGDEVFTGTGDSIEAAAFTVGLGIGLSRPDVVEVMDVEIETETDGDGEN
jgi:hypothetical protein